MPLMVSTTAEAVKMTFGVDSTSGKAAGNLNQALYQCEKN